MKRIQYKKSPDRRAIDFNKFIEETFPHFLVEQNPDIVLVAGGDGSLHHATKHKANFNGIYFGKGLGTLNFLMNSFDNDYKVLKDIENETIKLDIVETLTLDVYINDAFVCNSANDVVLGESINSYLSFEISTEDKMFNNFKLKGTGICISTPLGSTAFNYNNGGSILDLDGNEISITGAVCNKQLNDVIKAQKIYIQSKSQLYIDGVHMYSLKENDELVLKPSKKIKIGFINKEDFHKRRFELSHRKK